ncbi:MAG: OprO/OprP family phosphate-selective porin [Gammaproteobacteria bacterium]|nr:OprO/OprP family phosphate-selective porin [Gammaproteobacteria bacterium]
MKVSYRKASIAVMLVLGVFVGQGKTFAADWLALQGTEPESNNEQAQIWGFIQGQYQYDMSYGNSNNLYVPAKLIGPNLTSNSQFNIARARIGVRGNNFPLDNKLNYFLLMELGNNGITAGGKYGKLTDASVTLNHVPFAKVRIGMFKYPGSEEGLQSATVAEFINFSAVTNALNLERFPNDDNYAKTFDMRGNREAQQLFVSANGFEKPVGAFRDVGVQIFNTFKAGDWELSYATMAGNGNGLNVGDNDGSLTYYFYGASEWVFGGKGGRREGLKIYGWHQTGWRNFDTDFSNQVSNAQTLVGVSSGTTFYTPYSRIRSGGGFSLRWKDLHVSGEYMRGQGMIFLGAHKESFDLNVPGEGSPGDGLLGLAYGWYVDGTWALFNSGFLIGARFDTLNRLTGDQLETSFYNTTLAVQYVLNKKARLAVNYEDRRAVSLNSVPALEDNFSGLRGRISSQVTVAY